jgi:hypothetical protein
MDMEQALATEVARARAAAAAGDLDTAAAALERAEELQAIIGSWATGSGEGLASMAALYRLRGERADLLERLAARAADAARAPGLLERALALWTGVAADPNGLGDDTPAARRTRALRRKLRR